MIDVMRELNEWIDEIPPIVQQSRFGNRAFRIWFDRLCKVDLPRALKGRNRTVWWSALWEQRTWGPAGS